MSSIRARPAARLAGAPPQGPFLDLHIAVVELMCEVIPEGAKVVFLATGSSWDGAAGHPEQDGWSYVCRTAMSTTATWDGQTFRLDTLGACLSRQLSSKMSTVPKRRMVPSWSCAVGPKYQEPLYLISNMATAEEACRLYQKRFRIETFFSDQKSRGFHIHKSHLSDVQRLSRLLIAACLAYIWVVYWVPCAKRAMESNHPSYATLRLSLFQLGLRF